MTSPNKQKKEKVKRIVDVSCCWCNKSFKYKLPEGIDGVHEMSCGECPESRRFIYPFKGLVKIKQSPKTAGYKKKPKDSKFVKYLKKIARENGGFYYSND